MRKYRNDVRVNFNITIHFNASTRSYSRSICFFGIAYGCTIHLWYTRSLTFCRKEFIHFVNVFFCMCNRSSCRARIRPCSNFNTSSRWVISSGGPSKLTPRCSYCNSEKNFKFNRSIWYDLSQHFTQTIYFHGSISRVSNTSNIWKLVTKKKSCIHIHVHVSLITGLIMRSGQHYFINFTTAT